MPRIPALDSTDAPPAARPALDSLARGSGRVLNFYATLAHAPAALEGFLALKRSLEPGDLPPDVRERLAVRVAQRNACEYCLSAHAGVLRRLRVDDHEIDAARVGSSGDARARAALALADAILAGPDASPADALARAREAGLSDAEVLEVAAHVALNVFSNAVNRLADTELDLPRTPLALEAATRRA